MARMIPPSYAARTPQGEKELFDRIAADPGTDGWVVLHSLDLSQHRKKIAGEIDMVILVPSLGVLCVEVKGCGVSREGGKWTYTYGTSSEGPFKQASSAAHSLRDYVSEREPSLSKVLFFSAVVFTKAEFTDASPEWHPWQFINCSRFLRQPISRSITEIFRRAHEHFRQKLSSHTWYSEAATRLTQEQISMLVKLLRSDFECPISPQAQIESAEARIANFTEDQFEALDLLEGNPRVLFKGLAGTGKTLLAIEAARRACAAGKSILFVCFNRFLGQWLERQCASLEASAGRLKVCTFHKLLLEIAGMKPSGKADRDFWTIRLPDIATDRLLDDQRTWPKYDLIIVDEAQDLAVRGYMDVLDLLLTGGLAGGHWLIFGDFARQAIYTSEGGDLGEAFAIELEARSPNHARINLSINCRNAEPIADVLTIASGLDPGYRRVLQQVGGAKVTPKFYSSPEAQRNLLMLALVELIRSFRPEQIAIVSMRGNDQCCAARIGNLPPGVRLAAFAGAPEHGTISYASIHAFKGLEAPAIIITDIDEIREDKERALLYVGMSRARIALYVLMRESCRADYNRILDEGFIKATRRH